MKRILIDDIAIIGAGPGIPLFHSMPEIKPVIINYFTKPEPVIFKMRPKFEMPFTIEKPKAHLGGGKFTKPKKKRKK